MGISYGARAKEGREDKEERLAGYPGRGELGEEAGREEQNQEGVKSRASNAHRTRGAVLHERGGGELQRPWRPPRSVEE